MTQLSEINLSDTKRFVEGVPHDWFAKLRADDPIHWTEPYEDKGGYWSLVRHDDIQTASRDYQTFSSERGGITVNSLAEEQLEQQRMMMLIMDPPKHTKLRLLVNKGFTPRMINRLHDDIRAMAAKIVSEAREKGSIDFVTDVAAELPLQVIADIMGVPQADRAKLFEWSNRMIGSEDPEYAVSADDAFNAAAEMFMYANALAEEKRKDPGDDIISVLLQSEVQLEDGTKAQLNEIEFDLFFELLAIAGNETTRNLVAHGAKLLIDHPDQRRELVADPSLIAGAVEEMLRWASPVMYMRRTALHDTKLGGRQIKAGDAVALWYLSGNHDETYYSDPLRFDIHRNADDIIAFGAGGPHYCLGANLARMEARIMFEELLRGIPDFEQAGPVERLQSNFINGIKHLPISF